jgi:hypothetical protein
MCKALEGQLLPFSYNKYETKNQTTYDEINFNAKTEGK